MLRKQINDVIRIIIIITVNLLISLNYNLSHTNLLETIYNDFLF